MNKKLLLAAIPAMMVAFPSMAQHSVTTGGTKHVLVEESTGAWCQYCPDGAVYLANLIGSDPKVVGVSIHGGSAADNMKFADGNTVTSVYFTAFPLGMVDRVPYGSPAVVGISRSSWTAAATARDAVVPDFDVTLNHGYTASTGVVDIVVKVKTLKTVTGNYNINVYVIEDSVKGTGSGWDQVNYYNTVSGHTYFGAGNPIVGFNHMHVVRAMLGGPWGTTGVIANNSTMNASVSKTYTYTIPSTSNYKHFKLVALVQKDNTTNSSDRAINNVIEASVTTGPLPTGVGQVSAAVSDVKISPNPAADFIHIEGTVSGHNETRLIVMNAIGQVVIEKSYAAGNSQLTDNIQTGSLTNGMYYLHFVSEEGSNTEKIVISR